MGFASTFLLECDICEYSFRNFNLRRFSLLPSLCIIGAGIVVVVNLLYSNFGLR
jgi:intracellular sulfur oxidation DsrE/DsrF family protein